MVWPTKHYYIKYTNVGLGLLEVYKMTLKEDFNRHVDLQFQNDPSNYEMILIRTAMLEGAKWASKRIIEYVDSSDFYTKPREKRTDEIRDLMKELK